ncbi:glycosyltransferase family 1 protein [Clostridium sp. BL-8]|uniref:glycosyltransferase family 4 protein n=1 Tax=Clostridium sp. BL-8 TaxID=349938 RepID=UPI00098C5C46|nr:glycosyltransferase family 1 protein [Clostridium sp. BL-8]OOM73828.1 GDP-mannose-dependent alpha-(1-2)-phosphatidylinositol mannosyltransferase [Clostridium sp. BL-8]
MKVVIDIRKLSNKPSGIGMYIYNFVKGLMNYSDIEIVGITDVVISKEILELKALNLNIVEYGTEINSNFEVFKYFKFVEKVIGKEKPNIFWEPNFIIPVNLKRKFKDVKFIITIFDLIPILNPEFCSIQYRLYFRYFLYKTIKQIDNIIYISDTVKKQCEIRYEAIGNKKSLLNYVIIDKEEFDNIEVSKDLEYFLFIGNIEERKGIRILLDAYEKYVDNGGNKGLKIVGGIRDKNIEELIYGKINKCNGKIEYLGYVDTNEKNKLIQNSSALVFPSYVEGFGIPPVEAIMCGKPVIVSNIEIFKEILGDNGNYFDITGDYKHSVDMLHKKLFDYKTIDDESREKLINKYSSKQLSLNLVGFLKDIL